MPTRIIDIGLKGNTTPYLISNLGWGKGTWMILRPAWGNALQSFMTLIDKLKEGRIRLDFAQTLTTSGGESFVI